MAPEASDSLDAGPAHLPVRTVSHCAEDGPLGIPHAYSLTDAVFLPRDEVGKLSGAIAVERERLNRELAPQLVGLARRAVAAEMCCREYVDACASIEVESRLRLAQTFEAAADALGSGAFAGTFAVPEFVFDRDDLTSGRTTLEDLRASVLREPYGTHGTLREHLEGEFRLLCPDPPPDPQPAVAPALKALVPPDDPEDDLPDELAGEETLETDDG